MTNTLYPKQNLGFFAKRLKNIRQEKGYSLRGIADAAKVSHVVVSDIENHIMSPNLETLQALYKQLDIPFDIDEQRLLNDKNTISMLYEAIYYQNSEESLYHYRLLHTERRRLFNSLISIDAILACSAYNISNDDFDQLKFLFELEDSLEFLSESQVQTFNLNMGAYYFKQKDLQKALNYLNNNLMLYGSTKVHSLTLHYLAMTYERLYRKSNTIHYAVLASNLHADFANFNRKIEADLLMAKKFIEVGRFNRAQSVLATIDLTINIDDHYTLVQELRFLKSYLLYRKRDYEGALRVFQETPMNLMYKSLYEVIIYYRMNKLKIAKAKLEEHLKNVDKESIFDVISKVLLYDIEGDYQDEDFEKSCLKVIEQRFYVRDVYLLKLVYDILIRYYEANNRYEDALKFAKSFVNIVISS